MKFINDEDGLWWATHRIVRAEPRYDKSTKREYMICKTDTGETFTAERGQFEQLRDLQNIVPAYPGFRVWTYDESDLWCAGNVIAWAIGEGTVSPSPITDESGTEGGCNIFIETPSGRYYEPESATFDDREAVLKYLASKREKQNFPIPTL